MQRLQLSFGWQTSFASLGVLSDVLEQGIEFLWLTTYFRNWHPGQLGEPLLTGFNIPSDWTVPMRSSEVMDPW